MAKLPPNSPAAAASSSLPLVAEEVVADASALAPASSRSTDIAPAPPPAFVDPSLVDDGKATTLRAVVTHGSIRRDGKVYAQDEIIEGPADEIRSFQAQGVARILRRPA